MVSEAKPNPVGYQNKDVDKGLSNQIVTFEIVGGEGSDISDFYPVDENGDKLEGETTVQFYNQFGKLAEDYSWWYGENVGEGVEDGWFDENFDEPKSRPLDLGEGFKVSTTYVGSKLVYAGQVYIGEIAIPISKGLSSTGNIRPTTVHMKDLVPVDAEDSPVEGEITIQFYNEFGKLAEDYSWWYGENVGEDIEDGWFDENFDEPKDKELVAGQGFCISTTFTGAYLKFPAIGSK